MLARFPSHFLRDFTSTLTIGVLRGITNFQYFTIMCSERCFFFGHFNIILLPPGNVHAFMIVCTNSCITPGGCRRRQVLRKSLIAFLRDGTLIPAFVPAKRMTLFLSTTRRVSLSFVSLVSCSSTFGVVKCSSFCRVWTLFCCS